MVTFQRHLLTAIDLLKLAMFLCPTMSNMLFKSHFDFSNIHMHKINEITETKTNTYMLNLKELNS